jgi:hypothetical protein
MRLGYADALEPSQQQQDDNDNQHDAEPAGRIVAPTATVGPGRKGADEEQDQNDEENGSERHESSPLKI